MSYSMLYSVVQCMWIEGVCLVAILAIFNKMAVRGLGKISAVLLDLSGTLHVESTPTPSAVAALTR